MRKILVIALWELQKIFTNWKKALAIFLLPAALMMAALNLFPMLVNYLTTGAFSNHKVIVADAPASFRNYIDSINGTSVYKFQFLDFDEAINLSDKEIASELKKGTIFLSFETSSEDDDFDQSIIKYYNALNSGNTDIQSSCEIYVLYNVDSPTMETKAEQFVDTIITAYEDNLISTLGDSYQNLDADLFTVNEFNPVGKILDYRTSANQGASRVIPGIMVLLMYYCTYSLVSDIFASEKDRGFYNKLILTPVSRKNLFLGKLLAVTAIVSGAAIVTFVMMFFSSWLNHSNDAMSLLPFGMLLTPGQFLIILVEIVPTAFLMGVIAVNIVFNTEKIQDTITCLQYPLVLFLFDFFIQMFRGTRPMSLEFFVPLHNTLQMLRDVFMSEERLWRVILVMVLNTILAIDILKKTLRKELSK